jgi:hypothetical protein
VEKCSNKKNVKSTLKKTRIKLKAHTCLPQKIEKKNHILRKLIKEKQQIGENKRVDMEN